MDSSPLSSLYSIHIQLSAGTHITPKVVAAGGCAMKSKDDYYFIKDLKIQHKLKTCMMLYELMFHNL